MTLEMPTCEWHDCGREASWRCVQPLSRHPSLGGLDRDGAWLCDRDMRVVRVLAERFGQTVTLTPRWRTYAEWVVAVSGRRRPVY